MKRVQSKVADAKAVDVSSPMSLFKGSPASDFWIWDLWFLVYTAMNMTYMKLFLGHWTKLGNVTVKSYIKWGYIESGHCSLYNELEITFSFIAYSPYDTVIYYKLHLNVQLNALAHPRIFCALADVMLLLSRSRIF